MRHLLKQAAAALSAAGLCLSAGCSGVAGDGGLADEVATSGDENPSADAEPGTSLALEWSANGFEQLEARYQWSGSGVRDDVFEPNLSLSVPETDDAIWSSSCVAGNKVETRLYLAPPKEKGRERNRATFRFETDKSPGTRSYTARYVADGQYDGFAIVQPTDDPMFAEMKAGQWAYIQIGDDRDAVKLRISLAGAGRALGAFLPACSGAANKTRPAPANTSVAYTCDDGRTVTASYLGNDTDTPIARLTIDQKVVLLSQAIAGSGAHYEGESAGVRITWLTKADDGFLVIANAGDAEGVSEQTTRCSAL